MLDLLRVRRSGDRSNSAMKLKALKTRLDGYLRSNHTHPGAVPVCQ